MRYTKIQKFLSSLLIFMMLGSITFRIPFLQLSLYADSSEFYDLVSIIVDDETYSQAKSEIDRYSRDISGVLDNTKVVIMPIPEDATAYEISSMNESLYFDGYKEFSNVGFESKLVGTVLVGDIPLAYAQKDGQTSKSILPYTDFESKSYIYDQSKGLYSYNSKNIDGIKPEIWHGVISPNTGNKSSDIQEIKNYFDKNNDFYNGEGYYSNTKTSTNGKKSKSLDGDYEPYVFYFDSFRESSGLNYSSYIGYQGYLENKEDVAYNRFTKELAQKLKSEILGETNSQISELAKKVDPSLSNDFLESVDDSLDNVPDIQSRYIINNSIKSFVEIFSKGSIGELRKNVYNAGRYNSGQDVNVDFAPYLITVLDVLNDEIIKDFNNDLEEKIDELVMNGLSRNIAIPTTYYYEDGDEKNTYENYLFGQKASNISEAEQCSIYRGSLDNGGNLVEANRGINVNNIQEDQSILDRAPNKAACYSRVQGSNSMNGINGMNSPFNLDKNASSKGELKLANSNYKGAIVPLFDIGGSKSIDDDSKTNNPFFCIDNNYLLSNKYEYTSSYFGDDNDWSNTYRLPTHSSDTINYSQAIGWSCNTNNASRTYGFTNTFDQNFVNFSGGACEDNRIYLDGNLIKSTNYSQQTYSNDYNYDIEELDETTGDYVTVTKNFSGNTYECDGYSLSDPNGNVVDNSLSQWEHNYYKYKSVPSYIMHKSPESGDLTTQLDDMVSPSLPVDKDRYIDFIAANGSYQKIKYPYLYRIDIEDKSDLTIKKVSESLDQTLDEKSEEINKIIQEAQPTGSNGSSSENNTSGTVDDFFSSLGEVFEGSVDNPGEFTSGLTDSGKFIDNSEIYELLKTGDYPNSDFDLKEYLKSKGTTTIEFDGESKKLSYYDVLVFAIYWNNLNSVSAKYGFVFENYLSDQTMDNKEYFLPKNKQQYEIAYLGAPGSVTDMYVGLDPESKGENPYSDIVGKNQDISTKILGLNVSTDNSHDDGVFKCAPPEGVPIWEWIPAVMCRLGDMMPPTIKISDGACGPSLLTNEEKEELNECNGDVNKNGVNDCIENKLGNGILSLNSTSEKYFYNKNIPLKASIEDGDGNVLSYLGSTDIKFELVKVEASSNPKESIDASGKQIIFDVNNPTKSDYGLLDGYLEFNPMTIKSTAGISNHIMTSKNRDLDIYLKASINVYDSDGNLNVSKESEELKIMVRGDRLFNSSYKFENSESGLDINSGSSYVKASNNTNIYLFDGKLNSIDSISNLVNNNSISDEKLAIKLENFNRSGDAIDINYPLNVLLEKDGNILEETVINSGDLSNYKSLFSLEKTGKYELTIIDSTGASSNRTINVTPGDPDSLDLELSTTIMETGGNISTNFITILDKFNNPVSGNYYDLNFNIDGNGVVFNDNDKNDFLTTTFEGYKIFRLKSTQNIGENLINVSLKDSEGNLLITESGKINTLEQVNIKTKSLTGDFNVGGEKNKLQIELRDKEGNLIRNFDSRVYLMVDSMYMDIEKPYFDIKSGVGIADFKTKTIAGQEIPIEIQVEGLSSIYNKNITILPDDPIKMDLVISNTKMEASPESVSNLSVELKDKYNNLVFTDSNTNTKLEILPEYSHVLNSSSNQEKISEGKANYKIYGTVNPGVGYFKVSTDPSLESNNFIVQDSNGEVIVNGVGENSGKIETFYVWNKQKIDSKYYNSIYTTLLGSNYGDIETKDYLAGSVVFNKNSKALAATSLINNPFSYNDTFGFLNNGGFIKKYSPSDLSQDITTNIGFDDGNLYASIFNNSLNTYIGKVQYNLGDDFDVFVCDSVADCGSNEKTSISGISKNQDYEFYTTNGKLFLQNNLGKTLLEVSEDGKIIRKGSLSFDIGDSNHNGLIIDIKTGDNKIGTLFYDFKGADISISRDELSFNNKKINASNSIMLFLNSSLYGSYKNGKKDSYEINIFYNDPFASDNVLNTFSEGNNYFYENFENKGGLGWYEGNKTLLSFSSGDSVGESLKNNSSFSTINIGDPVVSLKKIRKKFNDSSQNKQFDSTIGKVISTDDKVEEFKVFDYNNDQRDDILLIKYDGYFQLLENVDTHSNYLDKGNLASIIDIKSTDLVYTGDFTGDGFDDIFFVGNDGLPYLLNNINKDFSRLSLVNKFDLDGKIIRAEVFDMDNDGIDDIVTLDDAGEINIFYGSGPTANPSFTKLNISNDYGVELSGEARNDKGYVYFDGLYQIDTSGDKSDMIAQNEEYLTQLSQEINNSGETSKQSKINYDLVNSILYEQIPYDDGNNSNSYNNITDLGETPNEIEQLSFIKSEYSGSAGVEVSKVYSDRNGGFLKAEDIVDVEITIRNNSYSTLEDIVYIEDVLGYFELDMESIQNSKNLETKSPNVYDFMIDGFNLSSNEEIIINYSVKTRSISYGYIDVGLFEKGESGDDSYGDILLKNSEENCGEELEIFRSTASRSYQKGLKEPVCDDPVPEELSRNDLDEDGNGVPDYIDELTGNKESLKEYSEEKLGDLYKDSDGDGLPDEDDLFNGGGNLSIDLGSLGDDIDSGLDGVQDIINGMSCGFNNGACFASPLNWAPLAPGGDPTAMGMPVGDGLMVGEGLPIFSAITWTPVFVPACVPVPTVWPMSSSAIWSACPAGPAGMDGAGGMLGTLSPTNTFRLFVTPTLTGGVGVAACFGAPPAVAGYSNMPGVSPLFPGGNCIVVAKPLLGCSNDGSDGNPESLGQATYGGSFGFINGNCSGAEGQSLGIDSDYVDNYYDHQVNGTNYNGLDSTNEAISDHSAGGTGPLLSIGGTGQELSISVDPNDGSADFGDITELVQKRIEAFPGFLMNWVTRQIEEIVNKLTDFPTIFVILPDFSGIYDVDLTWQQNFDNWYENSGNKSGVDNMNTVSGDNNISGQINSDDIDNEKLKESVENINEATNTLNQQFNKVDSGIKQAYEFIGSLPLVNIEQAPVEIQVPWISVSEIDKTILAREKTIESWKTELQKFQDSWSYGATCDEGDQECLDKNAAYEKIVVDANALISSLEANISAIKEYKEIPEKINELITKKEDYLEQILCNIESISEILGGRIGENGERFKAWVELYVLIKAILKSWQLLIDVFIDYEQECQDCKNERQDLNDFLFQLISMVVPDIPIIKFPKWPDIIIDLHNIRAGMDVLLPEFNIVTKPILLPDLPNLYLPESPSLNINLPSLPVIPTFEIPELPDLPTLPLVELPNLPPPPTLPKMFAQLEAILDILKLVTKAMCILKSSPFHPEWRAGDQIAFLTERNGYLPTDFLNVSMPQFSFPFIDAIKVTTYVNLEFETDFIVELARQVAMPINSFTSDFTNLFNISTNDLDFRGYTPNQIDINVGQDGNIDNSIGNNSQNLNSIPKLVSYILTKNIVLGSKYISENKNDTVSNAEFKKLVSKNLGDEDFVSDPRFDNLRQLWDNVNNYTYSGENRLIDNLQQNNLLKFQTLKDIVNTEIIKTKSLKQDFNDMINKKTIKTSLSDNTNIQRYKSMMKPYNEEFFKNTKNLVSYDVSEDKNKQDIIESGEKLIDGVNGALSQYTSNNSKKDLYAANTQNNNGNYTGSNYSNSASNSCSGGGESDYEYNYEGIYILEDNKSYRLFDYLGEVIGNEELVITDNNKDGDEDLFYLSNNTLYLKQNLDLIDEQDGSKSNPLVVDSSDNKFLNSDKFYPSVNNINERSVSSGIINFGFSGISGIYNYRFSFYSIIDKFLNEDNSSYTPIFKKKSVVDGFAGLGEINFVEEKENYIQRKNIVFIDNLGDLRGVKLETNELKNITNDIVGGKVVVLSNGTKLYSGNSTAVIKYLDDNNEEKSIILPKNRHIEIKSSMKVFSITGNAYVKTGNTITLDGTDILKYRGLPLFEGSKLYYDGNDYEVRDNTYVDLEYYDGSKLPIGFSNISDRTYLDMGNLSENYMMAISRENDYYYGVVNGFKDGVLGTSSKQILLSPQVRADKSMPEIGFNSIRLPVYQEMDINLTNNIYEDTGLSEVYIDFDLDIDSSGDGNPRNDKDNVGNDKIQITRDEDYNIIAKFGKFDELYDKEIGVIAIDQNGNEAFKKVNFEVYSPEPSIEDIENRNVLGKINENLDDEPVSLYRYRGGIISKLSGDNSGNIVYTNDGEYDFGLSDEESGYVNIQSDGNLIAQVNERTGFIDLKDTSYNINVLKSNDDNNNTVYPKILLSKDGKELFYQTIKVNSGNEVNIVSDFSGLEENGIYVQFLDKVNYNFNLIPKNASYNPGDMLVYRLNDNTNSSLFTIFKDGRINTLNDNYSIKYDNYKSYVVLKLIDNNFDREVASVLYKVDSDFIIK